jgi:SAM-dependent methyltransferase
MTPLPPPFACPTCRAPGLLADATGARCPACGAVYGADEGYPVLLGPGDRRFEDAADCGCFGDEERTNRFTTQNYTLPRLARAFPGREGLRVLSAGCGVGADVDVMRAAGVEAYGVDCGARTAVWARREHPFALTLGSVANLPYADASFDAISTGCLLPHIGVVGDTTTPAPDCAAARARVASELLRVLRPGGLILAGNPNRRCPVDLFHKGQMAGANRLMRWHAMDEPFLLSLADYRRLFAPAAVATLPPAGYWGFHSKRADPKMRVLVALLSGWFALLSLPGMGWARASPLNPWLMVAIRKPA